MNYPDLYKLQDKVFEVLRGRYGSLYLTGGTALSRFYLHHRYSDDLDFFVNDDTSFITQVQNILGVMNKSFKVLTNKLIQHETFIRIWIKSEGVELKLEFVNDVPFRWNTSRMVLDIPIDNVGNILANKLTALISRDEPKDVYDIVSIAESYSFSWPDVFENAMNKAIIAEPDVAMRLTAFPPELIQTQLWLAKPFDLEKFKNHLQIVSDDFLLARENSLGKDKKHVTEAKPSIT